MRASLSLALLLIVILPRWSPVLIVISGPRPAKEDISATSAEEHSEDIIRIELVFSEVLLIPLLEALLRAMLIVDLSLLGVVETSECGTYLLESIRGIGCPILVWMKLESKLLIRLLYVFFAGPFGKSEDFIVVLLGYHSLTSLNLKGSDQHVFSVLHLPSNS